MFKRLLQRLNPFYWLKQRRLKQLKLEQQRQLLMWLAEAKAKLEVLTRMVTIKPVGRNQKCPCGSGKKYKFCHGKDR